MDDRPLCPMCVQQRHVQGRGGFGGDDDEEEDEEDEKEAGHRDKDSLGWFTDYVAGEKRKSTGDHDAAMADLFDGLQELDDYFEEQKGEEPGPTRKKRAAVSPQEITPQVPQSAPRAAAAPSRRALAPAPASSALAADPTSLAIAEACAQTIVDHLIIPKTLESFDYQILALFMTTDKNKARYDGKKHLERMQNASDNLEQAKEEAVERLTARIMRIREIMPQNLHAGAESSHTLIQSMPGELGVFGGLKIGLRHDVSAAPCVVCVDRQAERPVYLCTSSALLDYTSHICLKHRKAIHGWLYKPAAKVYSDVPQVVDVTPPDNDVRRELQALAPGAVRARPIQAKQVLQRYIRRHAWMLLALPANQRRAEDRSAQFVQVPPQMRAGVSDLVDQCGLDLDKWLRHPDLPKMRVLLAVMEIANRNQAIWLTGMADINRAADMDVRYFQQTGKVRFVGGGAGAESKVEERDEEKEPSFTSMCLLAQHGLVNRLLQQTRARLLVTGSRRVTEALALEQQRHAMKSELVKEYCAAIRRDLEDTLRLSRDNLLDASPPALDQAYCLLLAIYQSRGGRAGPGQWPQPSVLLGRAHRALVVQPAPAPMPLPVLPDVDVRVHARPHTPEPPPMDNVWGADYDLEFDPEPLPPNQFDPGPSSPDEFDLLSLLDQKSTHM